MNVFHFPALLGRSSTFRIDLPTPIRYSWFPVCTGVFLTRLLVTRMFP